MDMIAQILKWLGWAGIVAGGFSMYGAFTPGSWEFNGIALPDTYVGAGAILAAGIVLMIAGSVLAKKSCGCCGKDAE